MEPLPFTKREGPRDSPRSPSASFVPYGVCIAKDSCELFFSAEREGGTTNSLFTDWRLVLSVGMKPRIYLATSVAS